MPLFCSDRPPRTTISKGLRQCLPHRDNHSPVPSPTRFPGLCALPLSNRTSPSLSRLLQGHLIRFVMVNARFCISLTENIIIHIQGMNSRTMWEQTGSGEYPENRERRGRPPFMGRLSIMKKKRGAAERSPLFSLNIGKTTFAILWCISHRDGESTGQVFPLPGTGGSCSPDQCNRSPYPGRWPGSGSAGRGQSRPLFSRG